VQGSAGPAMVALVQEGLGWVPTACNLAAALAFGLCLSLNAALTAGSDAAIFALAPLLLLLTQVRVALKGFHCCIKTTVPLGHGLGRSV